MGLFSEAERLHVLDAVPVVAVDTRQVGFPDLHQLVRTELSRVRIPVVIEISRDRQNASYPHLVVTSHLSPTCSLANWSATMQRNVGPEERQVMTLSNAGIMDRRRNQTKSAPGDIALFEDKCNIL